MDTAATVLYEANTLYARANSTSSDSSSSGRPTSYKIVGLCLAIASGLFIGVSFVLKKIGLLRANEKYQEEAGEGYGYLRNVMWWTGMTLMIIGEVCNFVAYAFTDAILVTPLGALSVVITTILSAIFLKERLSFVGKIGCFNCIIGSVVIVLNAPEQSSVSNIQEMQKFVITPGFLTYAGVIILGSAFTAFWVAPRYAKKSMLVYISICSAVGGLSVVSTQGLGSAILAQIGGEKQYDHWFLYVLFVFVVCTLLTEIIYLNVSPHPEAAIRRNTDETTESTQYLQCRSRHPDLLRPVHVGYNCHFRNSLPGLPRHGTRHHLGCHGLSSDLQWSRSPPVVEIGQGRSRRRSVQRRSRSS